MAQYFFVLGKNPTLSLAEIFSVLNRFQVVFDVKLWSDEILVISTDSDLFSGNIMSILGGTIKLGEIIDSADLNSDEENFERIFSADNLLDKYFPKTESKLHFGISVYDGGSDKRVIAGIIHQLKEINITIKENLKRRGIKSGFVRIKERCISSVSVSKNGLLGKGAEIVLIPAKEEMSVGKTLAVQEFESFSFRDYGRPQRDKRSGIIPPKLARMMINLASKSEDETLFDPFCGSGTILQEAIVLGFKNIIGSDISSNAVSGAKRNIDWLFAHYKNLNKVNYKIDIFQADVNSISSQIEPASIDFVVSEPYLGPPLFQRPDFEFVAKIFREIESLYLSAFREFYKILKKDGRVVFILPAFAVNGTMQFIPILDKIKKMGFSAREFFPPQLKTDDIVKLSSRNTIIYGGEEQFVKREITSWKKG